MDTRLRRRALFATAAGAFLAWAAEARAQSGPVGYWKGDDGPAATVALDSSPNARHGMYTGGAVTDPSVPTLLFPNPTSVLYNGTGAHVNVPNFPWPTGGPVTVAFWNFVTAAEVQNSSAFAVGNLNTPNRFQVHAPWGDSILYWDYGDLNGTGRVSTSYTPFLNRWTHVAVVSQGNGGTFRAIYLDGVLRASANTSDGPDVAMTGLTIGRWTVTALNHRGRIDDFRIYNRVLTAQQIQLLFTGATEPGAPTGLTASPGDSTVSLNWTALAGAASYNIKRSTVSGGPYATVGSATVSSHLDISLSNGTEYFYVVSAVGVGEGPNSNQASAVPTRGPDLKEGEEGIHGFCESPSFCWGVRGDPWIGALLLFALFSLLPRKRRPILFSRRVLH